jgi:hypothetical protein
MINFLADGTSSSLQASSAAAAMAGGQRAAAQQARAGRGGPIAPAVLGAHGRSSGPFGRWHRALLPRKRAEHVRVRREAALDATRASAS